MGLGLRDEFFKSVREETKGDAGTHLRECAAGRWLDMFSGENVGQCVFVAFFVFAADEFENDLKKDAGDEDSRTRKKRAYEIFFLELAIEIG